VIGADDAGFFAITLVVLLLTLTSLALLGPYQLALAEWHSIQRVTQHEGGS
jgi:cytochrome oxidase assembly protein ShyY1